MTELVNLSPSPDVNVQPMMMPAQAQATVTGMDDRTPDSRAASRSTGLMRVDELTKDRTNRAMIAQNAAMVIVRPMIRRTTSTTSASIRCQPSRITSRKTGSCSFGTRAMPYLMMNAAAPMIGGVIWPPDDAQASTAAANRGR